MNTEVPQKNSFGNKLLSLFLISILGFSGYAAYTDMYVTDNIKADILQSQSIKLGFFNSSNSKYNSYKKGSIPSNLSTDFRFDTADFASSNTLYGVSGNIRVRTSTGTLSDFIDISSINVVDRDIADPVTETNFNTTINKWNPLTNSPDFRFATVSNTVLSTSTRLAGMSFNLRSTAPVGRVTFELVTGSLITNLTQNQSGNTYAPLTQHDVLVIDITENTNPGGTDPICGNGVVESGEQCDDGNTNNDDSCTNVCRIRTTNSGGSSGSSGGGYCNERNHIFTFDLGSDLVIDKSSVSVNANGVDLPRFTLSIIDLNLANSTYKNNVRVIYTPVTEPERSSSIRFVVKAKVGSEKTELTFYDFNRIVDPCDNNPPSPPQIPNPPVTPPVGNPPVIPENPGTPVTPPPLTSSGPESILIISILATISMAASVLYSKS